MLPITGFPLRVVHKRAEPSFGVAHKLSEPIIDADNISHFRVVDHDPDT
jgi:hypothetical protein